MKNRIFTLIAFFCISLPLYSQHDFRQGFIIKNNNDTIQGFIDYGGEIQNSTRCLYKSKEKGDIITYKPTEIVGYRFIDDKYYLSKEVIVDKLPDKRFLEFLLHGIVDLYCLKDINGVRYFIQKQGADLIELKKIEADVYVNNVLYHKTKKEYVGLLKYMFNDAPNIRNKIDNVAFNRSSFINIAEDYHNQVCMDSKCVIYKKQLPKQKVTIGVIGGYNSSSITKEPSFRLISSDDITNYTYNGDFNNSINPIGGIYINIPFRFTNDKLSLQYEGTLNYRKFQSDYVKRIVNTVVLTNYYSFSYTSLYNSLLVRYDIVKLKFRPVILLGVSMNKNFNIHYFNMNIPETRNSVFNIKFPNVPYYGLCAGVGFTYKYNEKRELMFRVIVNRGFGLMGFLDTMDISYTLGFPIASF